MCDLTNPAFTDEDKARKFLEASRWPDGPVCPFCGQLDTVAKLGGKSMGPGWYYCSGCQDKFTVRVGTLMERSHIPMHKWLFASHLIVASKKGISALQLSRMLGITYKSSWFMCHRIREGMTPAVRGPIGGQNRVVEADETLIGGKKKTAPLPRRNQKSIRF
jgi:transposase-like protein